MEDIKVGEYVRTKKGSMGKFKFYGIDDVDNRIVYFKNQNGTNCVDENEVIKHSPNIIDLIEVGDYVNGYRVKDVWQKINVGAAIDLENNFLGLINDEDIENIVTHEQFKSVMYEV